MGNSDESKSEQGLLLALFQTYLDDLGRIGVRHETLRQFYITVISALFVFVAMAGENGPLAKVPKHALLMVGLVGVAICLSWFFHMSSFAAIFKAKRATLCEIEKKLPFQLFGTEDRILSQKFRMRLTTVDRIVAIAFVLLFAFLLRCMPDLPPEAILSR